ncbi:DUF1456 family protein [Marinomonas sp. 2405UD68-3]|uniref:DUF1456 family protein n=1 Tax=Marinomonas sp. 2405UD68-3 TaxID=3391835 RepID=UPI0039C9C8DB
MTNNDVLRKIRFIFDFNDKKMIDLFGMGGLTATRSEVSDWLKQDDAEGFQACKDVELASFLNGLIVLKRGVKDGVENVAETRLTNNMIFTKLKIALSLQAEEILEIIDSANFKLSRHELSAFFRRPSHKHYRDCQNQVLRQFLQGLQLKYRSV